MSCLLYVCVRGPRAHEKEVTQRIIVIHCTKSARSLQGLNSQHWRLP